jgi:hypothetical protein
MVLAENEDDIWPTFQILGECAMYCEHCKGDHEPIGERSPYRWNDAATKAITEIFLQDLSPEGHWTCGCLFSPVCRHITLKCEKHSGIEAQRKWADWLDDHAMYDTDRSDDFNISISGNTWIKEQPEQPAVRNPARSEP